METTNNLNVSVLVPGGLSSTFEAMTKVQTNAAYMQIEGIKMCKNLYPLMQALNASALLSKIAQGEDEKNQGKLQAYGNFVDGLICIGSGVAGFAMAKRHSNTAEEEIANIPTEPEESPATSEREVTDEAEASIRLTRTNPEALQEDIAPHDSVSPRASSRHSDLSSNEEEAPPNAENNSSVTIRGKIMKNTNQKEKLEKLEKEKEKIRQKYFEKQSFLWNTINNIATPGMRSISQGAFGTFSAGYNPTIRKDEGVATFDQSSSQAVSQVVTNSNDFVRGQEEKERNAAQNILAMINLSHAG
jgi:hypothetical protein